MKKHHALLLLAPAMLIIASCAAPVSEPEEPVADISTALSNLHQQYPRADFSVGNFADPAREPVVCSSARLLDDPLHGNYTDYLRSRLIYWLGQAGMYRDTGATMITANVRKIEYASPGGTLLIKAQVNIGALSTLVRESYNLTEVFAPVDSCQKFVLGYKAAVDAFIAELVTSPQFEAALKAQVSTQPSLATVD